MTWNTTWTCCMSEPGKLNITIFFALLQKDFSPCCELYGYTNYLYRAQVKLTFNHKVQGNLVIVTPQKCFISKLMWLSKRCEWIQGPVDIMKNDWSGVIHNMPLQTSVLWLKWRVKFVLYKNLIRVLP